MEKIQQRNYIQLILLYGLIGLIIAAYSAIIYSYLRMQSYDTARINSAGRLRMLSQKITKDILLFQDGKYPKQSILNSIVLFDTSINAITYGGTFPLDLERTRSSTVPIIDDPENLECFRLAIREWEPFRDRVKEYLMIKNDDSLRYILTRNESLMLTIDRAVLSIQEHADSDQRDLRLFITSAVILIIVSVLVLLAREIKRYRRAAKRLEEIEQLLPICAGCKKIRVNESLPSDPRSWTSIEEYLREKKDMVFTHSLCPDCMMKYYPDAAKGGPENAG
jgi:nitrate/nitrite-specific signal transduction histidine kinase